MADTRPFQVLRARIHLLGGTLDALILDDRGIDEGLAVADRLLWRLDDLLEGCFVRASRGGTADELDRAAQLIRMKRHVFGRVQRYVADATGGVALATLERRARNEIAHARSELARARQLRVAALAG